MTRTRVAIVGAGYAGMAAAVELADAGACVAVFESGPTAGGRARRIESRGIELDNGQHVLLGAYRVLLGLLAKVGVAGTALLRTPLELRYADGFRFRAAALPAPFGLLAGLLGAARLTWPERLSAVRFMRALQRQGFRLEKDTSVDALLARHGQTPALARYLWHPLCISALNTPPQQASASIFLAVLRDGLAGRRSDSDLLLPRVDLTSLFPQPAAAYVMARGGTVRYGSRVTDLHRLRAAYEHVIVAAGPHQLKALLPSIDIDYAYQPIYTCYLQYPDSVRLPSPMLGLTQGYVQWVFDRGALMAEKGRMACVISAAGAHQDLAQEDLAAACHAELAACLDQLPAPLWSRVIAEKRATIRVDAGVRRLPAKTDVPGVVLAGDYLDPEYPPTLEAAVRSGVRAAALVLGRETL